MVMVLPWISAFLLTQLIECPIYRIALGKRSHAWLIAFGASAMTHPIVFFGFPLLFPVDYWRGVATAEAFAVIGEAIWLSKFGVPNSLTWTLLANALSAGIGLSLRAWIGWP